MVSIIFIGNLISSALEKEKTMKFGGVNVVKSILPFMTLSGIKFYYLQEVNLVEVEDHQGRKVWIKLPMVKGIGVLQRFAVEWYYQNILNQNFGGKEMAPYEVVLKNY